MQLNKSQQKAVEHKTGPLLVVAGAGTGKTSVITQRIKNLIQKHKVDSQNILALTFTEKAAQEMVLRIGDVMPLGYEEPWVYTFHKFADRILKEEGLEIGLDSGYKILSGSNQWLLLRKHIFDLDLKYFRPLGNPTKFISAILKFISRLQDENISEVEFRSFVDNIKTETEEEKARWEELAYLYEKYQELKIQNSKLDFGDLISWTIKLFKERPNILAKYQEKFKHVLVDEFQDTNYAQYELVKLLCPQSLGKRSLVAVGDDSQSIYKFRGAAVSNIIQFMEDYPEAEMVSLLKNYRSTQKILDPSYKLIQGNNPDTLESKLGISKQLKSQIEEKGEDPIINQADTLEDEVEFVIAKILEILAKEPEYTYKDFAILGRANNHLEPFLMALRKYGLPYQLVGNRGLYDRDEIRDILAFLRTICNPKDAISLYRVLNIDSLQIPYNIIANLLKEARYKKVDMWDLIQDSKIETLNSLYEKIQNYQEQITKTTPSEFVYNLVHSINYLSTYLKEETIENQMCIKNLDIFLNKIKQFEVEFHDENKEMPTIIDLVDHIELMNEAGDNPAQAEIEDIDTINLMTVHASKGLEFPVVFMINLTSDRFPTRNRKDIIQVPDELVKEHLPSGNEHIQEERRLFYVGMTRAKKYLFMNLGKNYGGKREKIPSGYLKETGLEIQNIDLEVLKNENAQSGLFGVESGFRDPKIQKIPSFDPPFLSYSQISKYQTCPLQYKYAYVLKIPTPPSHALSFGITIHDTLKDFHTKKMFDDNVTLEDLYKIYDKNWNPLGYDNEKHRKTRYESGKELLKKYYEKHKNENLKHFALEKAFNLRLGGVKFFGRIDRIDKLEDGSYEIVDYKTGSTKSQKDVDKDAQVTVYAMAAKKALGIEPKKLSYYFVESGEKVSTTRTESDFKKQEENIQKIINNMREGKFEPKPGMMCKWCDYSGICPFAKL